MQVPSHLRETDFGKIKDFIRTNDFATVVFWDGMRPIASHLLVELHDVADGTLRLEGHMARGNDQGKTFKPESEVLSVFLGPHAYISPTWYSVQAVPTWNSISAHVYGTSRIVSDHDELYKLLENLVRKHESTNGSPDAYELAKVPREFGEKMMAGVVGFQITVRRIEVSFKLSQNRKEEDYQNIIFELRRRSDTTSRSVADAMEQIQKDKTRE